MLLIQMAFSGDFQLSETFTSEISDFITCEKPNTARLQLRRHKVKLR